MRNWIKKLARWFNGMKYRKKLRLVLILVSLLPLAIVCIYMISGFYNMMTGKELESIQVSLTQTCNTIENQAEIYENLLNYSVFDEDLQEVLDQEQSRNYESYNRYVNVVDPILNRPKFYHDGVSRMTIYADNIEIAHDTTLAPLAEIENRSWYGQLKETDGCLWVWPNDAAENSELLVIRRFPGYRETEAYLGLYCNVEKLTESLKYYQRDGGGMLLADAQNHIILSYSELEGNDKIGSIEDVENNYHYIRQKIQGLPLNVYIFVEESEFSSGFYELMGTVMLVVAGCLFFVIIISKFMSGLLVKRIELLTGCVNQVEAGNMEINIQDDNADEVGILIRSFKKMLGQLNRLINEVYQGKIKQQDLEMQALQAQINPHFLYNTLSLINWKAISAGEEDISRVTLALSDYYRTTLNKGEILITVGGEITNIKSYLEIQRMMHDYEFDVEFQVDQTLFPYLMPKLTLQPLVENALEHGLDVKEEGEKRLTISCQQNYDDIIITVYDTGVGMDEETVEKLLKTKSKGYGVRNVNDRLALMYGENYTLHIESYPGTGTRVKIHIPKKTAMEGKDIKK